jgi:hypothetical protein
MSKKIVKKPSTSKTSETDELLAKYAEQYEVPLASLKKAHAEALKEVKDKRNPEKLAMVRLLGSLREGKLVDTEPASFVLTGVSRLYDRNDFAVKTASNFIRDRVPEIYDDLKTEGNLNLGAPTYTSKRDNTTKSANSQVIVYAPANKEDAVKEHGANNLLDISVDVTETVDGRLQSVTVQIPAVAIDTMKVFPKNNNENPNFEKPITHNYFRRYTGIGVRHNDGEQTYTPVLVTQYGENAKTVLPVGQHIDYDVKVNEVTDDKKNVVLVTFSLPEYTKPLKVYDRGVKSEHMEEQWVVKLDDDIGEIIDVAADWFKEMSGIDRNVDVEAIDSMFLNKKDWKPLIALNLPQLYTGYFQVIGRSPGVIFADVIAGRMIDADAPPGDMQQTPTLGFQVCSTNPQSDELRKGDVMKAIFFLGEQPSYNPETQQRNYQEPEPLAFIMGWGWEHRAGSESRIEGTEVS